MFIFVSRKSVSTFSPSYFAFYLIRTRFTSWEIVWEIKRRREKRTSPFVFVSRKSVSTARSICCDEQKTRPYEELRICGCFFFVFSCVLRERGSFYRWNWAQMRAENGHGETVAIYILEQNTRVLCKIVWRAWTCKEREGPKLSFLIALISSSWRLVLAKWHKIWGQGMQRAKCLMDEYEELYRNSESPLLYESP